MFVIQFYIQNVLHKIFVEEKGMPVESVEIGTRIKPLM